MYFDTHTHVNFDAYKEDQEDVIKRSLDNGTWLVNVGTQSTTSKATVELAANYTEGVYATIGLHPLHTFQHMVDEEESHFESRQESFDEKYFESLLSDKVVGVGECGLEYFRLPSENQGEIKLKQKEEFIKQIHFAKKHNLALVVHCREAYEDLLEILRSEYQGLRAIIHSFTHDWDTAKKFLDLGYYIALNGILAFDKTGRLAEVCKNTPLDRLLSETDAPYLAPPPYRGKRNEPSYVKYVVMKIAELKNMDTGEVENQLFQNALNVYGIKK
jgi:TatD DNase family protein